MVMPLLVRAAAVRAGVAPRPGADRAPGRHGAVMAPGTLVPTATAIAAPLDVGTVTTVDRARVVAAPPGRRRVH